MEDRRNVYLYYKRNSEIEGQLNTIKEFAKNYGFNIVDHYKESNIIVSFGGDGSFLQAVRNTNFRQDCLYVGVATNRPNSLYSDFSLDDKDKIIEAISSEQLEVRKYPVLEVSVDGQSSFLCLNECSIRSGIIKTFVIDVWIDDQHFETFRGDGMLVSTPTGSTAYNKSVNGAVVDPKLPCLQVNELASLNNNKYRTLGSPFILSNERKLRLQIVQDGNDHPIIGIDNEALSIRHVKNIDFKLSEKVIKTVKLKDNSFWDKVKRTFL
ncbi:NAD kinase [Bacillus carboniphilus]